MADGDNNMGWVEPQVPLDTQSTTNINERQPQQNAEQDEKECRVCRGPEEEDRPLYHPCKCSGSIGLTHQDCLVAWLDVQRRGGSSSGHPGGSCELCKTPFRFMPQYAEGTPDRLPLVQVVAGLSRRATALWLPLLLRCLLAISLWLLVAPLVTAYLYHCWMDRPAAIMKRFHWNLLVSDLVSGGVVATCVIVSFLSLMSFADFLRMEWHRRGRGDDAAGGAVGRARRGGRDRRPLRGANRFAEPVDEPAPRDEDIDMSICEYFERYQAEAAKSHDSNENIAADPNYDGNSATARVEPAVGDEPLGISENAPLIHIPNNPVQDDEDSSDESWNEDEENDEDSDDDDFVVEDENDDGEVDDDLPALEQLRDRLNNEGMANNPARHQERNNDAQEGRVDPAFDQDVDDGGDVDINLALDELLGIRGPLHGVVRNLLWLLAFNAVYLGFFAFMPRTIGSAVSSLFLSTNISAVDTNQTVAVFQNDTTANITGEVDLVSNVTVAYVSMQEIHSVIDLFRAVERESEQQKTAFRLNDLMFVVVGYLSCASAVVFLRFLWTLSQKVRFLRVGGGRRTEELRDELLRDARVREAMDEAMDALRRMQPDADPHFNEEVQGVSISVAIGIALDAMMAIVKVGVLLFLKMFVLPIGLGLCLDGAVMNIVGSSLDERIAYAGQDLFSFILLHWVLGITFMLLVTVSVLQLREVAHPELLAQAIRPQEPQPDLLGNLMHERISTHAKRMVLSLIIYAVLLSMHVLIPVRFFNLLGMARFLPMLKLKFCYVMTPRLQVPLELLVFHLCMLSLLEKYKSSIGEMQHHWLKWTCRATGLTKCMLPQLVDKFQQVGSLAVFDDSLNVDPLWLELVQTDKDREDVLLSNLDKFAQGVESNEIAGESKQNGERVLRQGSDYIQLPDGASGPTLRRNATLLPTKIGRYRLQRDVLSTKPIIQLWIEVPGMEIPRPPEGWDDLLIGGADIQGRWAWDREKKSSVETGIAARHHFFPKGQKMASTVLVWLKLFALAGFSWFAASSLLCFFLITPLAVGRFLYYIFRVPDNWIHDPVAFSCGMMVAFPWYKILARVLVSGDIPLQIRFQAWVLSFRVPPARKAATILVTAVISLLICPLLLGAIFDLAFVYSDEVFATSKIFPKPSILSWTTGIVLLISWFRLCIVGVLTRRFQMLLIEGRELDEDNNQANAQAAAWLDAGEGRLRLTWQGRHGRAARFWDTCKAILLNFEWDKVDGAAMLQDFAMPILSSLTWSLFYPLAIWWCCHRQFPDASGLQVSLFVRAAFWSCCALRVSVVWKSQLLDWFEAAHRAARDERYLIGKQLLNFGESEFPETTK